MFRDLLVDFPLPRLALELLLDPLGIFIFAGDGRHEHFDREILVEVLVGLVRCCCVDHVLV